MPTADESSLHDRGRKFPVSSPTDSRARAFALLRNSVNRKEYPPENLMAEQDAADLKVKNEARELTQAYNVQYDHFDPRLAA